jgi:hypothetical protein
MSTHITLANQLIKLIKSYENPEISNVALHVDQTRDSGYNGSIYIRNRNFERSHQLFVCSKPIYSDDYLFSLRSSAGLYTIFRLLAQPETFSPSNDNEEFISNLVWFKAMALNIKDQIGHNLFHELTYSILIDMSITMKDDNGIIKFNFSKHSIFLNKNIHYNISFDLSFKFIEVNFDSKTYVDNYQRETLVKFKSENQLAAFYTLFSYYCHPSVHQSLDTVINVANDLNDDNLYAYEQIVNMIKI